ncbi:hypothetical protein GCM10022261_24920 [Brevibacterium daeguense]|uniref:PDZ domain-containing protein n=1 Tax=Brevibacterium daeguense TaxID=909936 RepID=A0ABP8ELU7_9MICO|nr:site-2 protease family protein [Brevibacterium daeguense]
MSPLLYALGVVLLVLGVSISIALHELGHLIPAKRFGVKVTHYMIGFGPTLFSFRRGETEYGVKALPLGGFIAMPGMYPPEDSTHARAEQLVGAPGAQDIDADEDGIDAADIVTADARLRAAGEVAGSVPAPAGGDAAASGAGAEAPGARSRRRGRLFERTMADAREFSNQEIDPGEEHRTFYALTVPRRLVVMFGGPFVNLLLGIGVMAIVLLGIGTIQPTTTVASTVECAVPASEAVERPADQRTACQPGDPLTPAWEIGLQPGDVIVSIDGTELDDWDELAEAVGRSAGETVPMVIERDGQQQTLQVPIIATERPVTDDDGVPVLNDDGTPRTETTGFLGVSPTQERRPLGVLEFPGEMAEMIGQTFQALFTLPEKLVEITQVALSDAERDPNGPIGMVGVGRVAGEIVGTDRLEVIEKVQVGLSLLGSLNLFLFAFNMVPLLPLDGGHVAVALYEGGRRQVNLKRGHGIIGPFDTARLLPLTYAVVGVLLGMTVLLLYVDIFKPVVLFS